MLTGIAIGVVVGVFIRSPYDIYIQDLVVKGWNKLKSLFE